MDARLTTLVRLAGELFVWNSAIAEQTRRLEAAHDAYRTDWSGADLFDFAEAEHRFEYEAHFLAVAIGNVLRYVDALRKLTGDHRVRDDLSSFEAAFPHAKDFRDFLTHKDAYIVGKGDQQRGDSATVRPDAILLSIFTEPGGLVTLQLDSYSVPLTEPARAAADLAAAASDVVGDLLVKWQRD